MMYWVINKRFISMSSDQIHIEADEIEVDRNGTLLASKAGRVFLRIRQSEWWNFHMISKIEYEGGR